MKPLASQPRPTRLKIGRISIKSESALDARRLADALPELLSARLAKGPLSGPARRQSEWAEAADQIARVIEQRMERGDG